MKYALAIFREKKMTRGLPIPNVDLASMSPLEAYELGRVDERNDSSCCDDAFRRGVLSVKSAVANLAEYPVAPDVIRPSPKASIRNLKMGGRIWFLLERKGISKIEELVAMTREELLAIDGIGVILIIRIHNALVQAGFRLRESSQP